MLTDSFPERPSIVYGELFSTVERNRLFPDSKRFADMIPNDDPRSIMRAFFAEKNNPNFDLANFVGRNFYGPVPPGPVILPSEKREVLLDYVNRLWDELVQSDIKVPRYSTLLPLPEPYMVPGGRFREMYYWDSYFTILGLLASGRLGIARSIVRDFAFEIDAYGHVPPGNRSYYLSRSQPPFFALMVDALAKYDGPQTLREFLPQMMKEWHFWMEGYATIKPGMTARRLVCTRDGMVLNRYWDPLDVPRDESYREDIETAEASGRNSTDLWRNIRAATESGWDFSSRWLADGRSLSTIRTLSTVPVDLNSLLWNLENVLAKSQQLAGDTATADEFATRARRRADAIKGMMWDASTGCFADYLYEESRTNSQVTAASLFPLFFGIASPEQAAAVALAVQQRLLKQGGLSTTDVITGQQWDAPNGWAPLQWVAIQGFRNYGEDRIAEDIATRWFDTVVAVFRREGILVEKYNVWSAAAEIGKGGEYATQIGFGWTNGVLLAIAGQYPDLRERASSVVRD